MSVWIRVRDVLAAALLVFLIGCNGGDVVWWSPDVRSDDGYWIAKAHSTVYSGFGSGGVETKVEIERINPRLFESPREVLGFDEEGDDIGLKMRWDKPNRLVVVYQGDPKHLYFQVLKTSGVDISVENLSMDSQLDTQPTPQTTR